LNFTASGNRVTLTKPIVIGSISFWANAVSGTSNYMFGAGSGHTIQLSSGKWLLYDGAAASTGTVGPTNGLWQFWTFVYNGTGYVHYLNGVAVSTTTGLQITIDTISRSGSGILGKLDEVRVFSARLTPDQVADLYFVGKIQTTNPPGPSGQWLFDEGSGTTAIDTSGNGNNGTITGATYTTDVPMVARSSSANRLSVQNFTSAIHYGGASNRTQSGVTNLPTIQGAKSISMWFKPTAFTDGTTIMSYELTGSAGVAWSISGSNVLAVSNWGGGTLCTWSTIPNHQYSFLTYTYDGTNHKTYLNGTLIQTSSTASQTGTATAFYTGAYSGGGGCVGNVADTRIYGRALTDAEVASLYYTGKNPTNTVLWHQFSEGAGTSVTDYSGNGNTGTITGATWTADVPMKARLLVQPLNKISNGDFETTPPFTAAQTTSNWMDGTAAGTTQNIFGWVGAGLAATRTVRFDTTVSHSGAASIKMSQTGTATAFGISTGSKFITGSTTPIDKTGFIEVIPSSTYILTAYIKTTKQVLGGGEGVRLACWEYTGTSATAYNGTERATSLTDGTFDWTLFTLTFTTGATTNAIIPFVFFASTDNTSFCWVDDVVLKPITPTTRSTA